MRVSELQDRLATITDSATAQKWGVRQMVSVLNDIQRSLVRQMARADQAFVNHRFTVSAASMRTVHADEFSCRLPAWVMNVTGVRENAGASDGRKPLVERANKWGLSSGWHFTASNELTFYRMGQARAFDIECAKLPARMTKGTLPSQAGLTTSQLKLDSDPVATADYPHETIQNFYAGGLFEITGPASARVGQLLRCVASAHDQSAQTVLTMEEAWTAAPQASDTYEMHTEIPDQHINLLLLMAANRLFAQANSAEAMQGIRAELSEELEAFRHHTATRSIQEPYYIGDGPRALLRSTQEYT